MTDAKREGNKRYKARHDKIKVQPQAEAGERIREAAAASGKSIQRYILDAVQARMEKDGFVMGE